VRGGQCDKKNLLHWAPEVRYDTALNLLKSLVGANVHKTIYGPLIDTVQSRT
jgi:hypothetical protein